MRSRLLVRVKLELVAPVLAEAAYLLFLCQPTIGLYAFDAWFRRMAMLLSHLAFAALSHGYSWLAPFDCWRLLQGG